MIFSPAKNLDPQLPREGITKRKLPHAGLILPWPWESKEREDLGSLGLGAGWARGEWGRELSMISELLGEREEWFKWCGPKTHKTGSTGQTGQTRPVRPVRLNWAKKFDQWVLSFRFFSKLMAGLSLNYGWLIPEVLHKCTMSSSGNNPGSSFDDFNKQASKIKPVQLLHDICCSLYY